MRPLFAPAIVLAFLVSGCAPPPTIVSPIPIEQPQDVDLRAPYPLFIHIVIDRCTSTGSGTLIEGRLRLISPDPAPEPRVTVSGLEVEGVALIPYGTSPSAATPILEDPNTGNSVLFTITVPHEGQADGCSVYLSKNSWNIAE